jgi:hypothetical protein
MAALTAFQLATRMADIIEMYGFERGPCKRFVEDDQVGYHIGTVLLSPKSRLSMYLYTGPYLSRRSMFWIGFGCPKTADLSPAIKLIGSHVKVVAADWEGKHDIKDSPKRRKILKTTPYVLEDYAHIKPGYWRWVGRYLTLNASAYQNARETIMRVLDRAVPRITNTDDIGDDTPTEKKASVNVRTAQAKFKTKLVARAYGRCEVTGSRIKGLLKASHIVAWARATPAERTDPSNGLLLIASIDAVFDRGFISFDSKGRMIVSPLLSGSDRAHAGIVEISGLKKKPTAQQQLFLARHRQWFRKRLML